MQYSQRIAVQGSCLPGKLIAEWKLTYVYTD